MQGRSRHQIQMKQASSPRRSGACQVSTALVQRSSPWGISAAVLLFLCSGVNVVVIKDLRVPAAVSDCLWLVRRYGVLHHDLPGVHWEVSVVERPIKLFLCTRLIGRVMVRCKVWVSKCFCRLDTFPWVKDQHVFEQIDGY